MEKIMKFNCPRCGAVSNDFINVLPPSVEFTCNACSKQVEVEYKPKRKQKPKKFKKEVYTEPILKQPDKLLVTNDKETINE